MKKNLIVKLSAYIMMIICAIILAFSILVIGINVWGEWYSSGEKAVERELYERTASVAQQDILNAFYDMQSDNLFIDNIIEDENEDESYSAYLAYLKSSGQELMAGESSAAEFGYSIFPCMNDDTGTEVDKKHPIWQVNPELSKKDGVIISGSNHGFFQLEIYLGDLNSGQIPEYLVPVYKYLKLCYEGRYFAIGTGIVSFLAALFLLVFLIVSIGENRREREQKERRNAAITAIPLDLAAGIVIVACICLFGAGASIPADNNFDLILAGIAVIIAIAAVLVSGFILLAAARIKLGTWWKSTVVYQMIRLIRWVGKKMTELITLIPMIGKSVLIMAVGLMINLILMLAITSCFYNQFNGIGIVIWILYSGLLLYGGIRFTMMLKKLKEGGKHLAEGDLDYKIDEQELIFDFKEHADHLNSVRQGMEVAIASKLQSERFKNELITNVSHDLKTPLTSIISYVDLLKKENLKDEKAAEYIEVLDRQSQRLKKLTEDVVEASKAATGNVKLEMRSCQAGVLMTQLMGEYAEKAEENDLNLIIQLPDEELCIMADSRSMWRTLNNLMSNICKYSQPGTRVYQILEKKDRKAVLTYKNTSKYELNISEDELMERFVRGDSSRHTEGSGLGLSIARNLVELQGGTFQVHIDGDLFKVVLEFPLQENLT